MIRVFRTLRFLGACAALCVLLSACASPEEPVPYKGLSMVPPPAPLMEEKLSPSDPPRELWIPGYWSYDGKDFTWVPGKLVLRPNATAVWSGNRWEERAYGWAYIPGCWQ